MFKVTRAAAAEIRRSLQSGDDDDLPLRIAAQRVGDGSVHYQMGFDEAGPGDTMISSSGVDVVIANEHKPLLSGVEMDFVEMPDDGQQHFIFLNPNDPTYVEPDKSEPSGQDPSDQNEKENDPSANRR